MVASVQNPEDVCNLALDLIGYERRIGSVFEGSQPSRVALDLFAQTRDEMFRAQKPGFANRTNQLTLQKSYTSWTGTWTAAAQPPYPWLYSYAYPDDCLELLYLFQPVAGSPPFNNPIPVQFEVYNDQQPTPPKRDILCNLASPLLANYIGQVTDMTTWDPLFVETLAAALARKFTAALQKTQQLIEPISKITASEEAAAGQAAVMAEER